MYWEVFGLVLVTLYFVLSLLFPKTEEYSNKTQRKREDAKHEEIHADALEKHRQDLHSLPVESPRGVDGDNCCEVAESSLRNSASCRVQAELIEQKVKHPITEFDISSSKSTETVSSNIDELPSNKEVSNGVKTMIDSLELNAIESLSDAQKLCELESINPSSEQLLFSLNDFKQEEKIAFSGQAYAVEKEDQERYSAVNITNNEDNVPSKYLYMECKNSVQPENGLPTNGVGFQGLSDFTDKTDENIADQKPRILETTNFRAEDQTAPAKLSILNITTEMTAPPSLQNDENLDKFANGLACSTIETAVDNSISLNNFAENLSEKIFWESADDVISKVNASIEKQKQESNVKLKPENLESLGISVASEVVNEAIGEAALKKEYMSDDETDLASPQRIQPQIGYVVENVVNNAICEAALKLKRDREDEGPDLAVSTESISEERSEILKHDESLQVSVILPDGLNKELEEETHRKLEKPNNLQNIETKNDALNSSPEEQKQPIEIIDKTQDKHNGTASKNQVIEPEIFIESTPTDSEKVTDWADDVTIESSGNYTGTEQESDNTLEVDQAPSVPILDNENQHKFLQPDQTSPPQLIAERETVQVREIEQDIVEKKTSEPNSAEAKIGYRFIQTERKANPENVKSLELEKQGLGDLSSATVCQDDLVSIIDSTSFPEVSLTVDKDSSLSSSELEDDEPGPVSSQDQGNKVTLSDKGDVNGESKENFWRKSLILDLEQDFDLEESFSSEATSPDSPKPMRELQSPQSNESEEFIDSEEDEIIDHDGDAKLGAVGGSTDVPQDVEDEEFDFYDYGSEEEDGDDDDDDEEEENIFEPVLTVDGLCVSKQTEKKGKSKKKGNLKSVGSHYNRAIVVDNGCGIIKVGYAGDRIPRVVQQAVSAIPQRFSMQMTGLQATNLRDFKKFGDFAVAKAGVMHLNHPMKAGMIDNWTDIEDLWETMIFDELGADIGDNPIIMTELAQNPKKNREKITEILFEHLSAPAMFLADQLPLSIYASGLTSGVCLSSGYSCTQAAVIYEGHTLAYTLQHLDIGGGHLTENLKMLLREVRARNFTSSSGWQIVNDIKEKIAFIASDYEGEVHKYKTNDSLTQYYTLPDGQVIDIGYECMSCVEPLFKPDELMSADATTAAQSPVHYMVNNAIKRCDADLQKMCYNNIILSGGTTNLKGFSSRLQRELHGLNHRIHKLRLPEHRGLSPWIGGSILGSLPVFDDQYVTMDEYGDMGPHIVHKKCF